MTDSGTTRPATFRQLHAAGCFLMPNPWDRGTAIYLESLGFPALATTSAGFAWSAGRPDNGITLEQALGHMNEIAVAVEVPVNADFEGGFAIDPSGVAANVARAVRTGIAGLSIEDSTTDPDHPLLEFSLCVERIRAAREAIDRSGTGVLLTGRSEGFVVGRPDLDETVRRLHAYAEAGAECLFAPRISTREQITAIVTAVSPKPVNLLVNGDFITVAEAAALGVRRISVGGTLARAAWGGVIRAAREILEQGTFSAFSAVAPPPEFSRAFVRPSRRESSAWTDPG